MKRRWKVLLGVIGGLAAVAAVPILYIEIGCSGETKAGALRNAKLSILKREGSLSPYFWAGFTLWGDGISKIGQLN